MATSELDTTPVEWKVVRENLVQLHCEDVSWEQATDKIPLDLVRYLLGDLVPHLSTLVFLRGNRCLFTIGDEKKNKLDFDMWERQVLSAATTHSGAAIKQAMMQSLKGQALMVTSALPPDASWENCCKL